MLLWWLCWWRSARLVCYAGFRAVVNEVGLLIVGLGWFLW